MRGLLNAAQRWFDDGSPAKWEFYLRVLDLLSVVTQESYPYHVDKVRKYNINFHKKYCSQSIKE